MRESCGPEFDNHLIRLVRENPAIYDVNHEHYRRNPVRVAIWERIAAEMRTPSKFLQTKWKNIRYNYLQELKCLETGISNTNIRKRRFTEDLSFLQNTAQTYKKVMPKNSSYNGSDHDSNSFLYADPKPANAYEIIEIEHSDDGSELDYESKYDNGVMQQQEQQQQHPSMDEDYNNDNDLLTELGAASVKHDSYMLEPEVTIEQKPKSSAQQKAQTTQNSMQDTMDSKHTASESHSSPQSYLYNPSSPLLTPLVVMGNGQEEQTNGEITIEPIPKQPSVTGQRLMRSSMTAGAGEGTVGVHPNEIMSNAAKRKATPAPFPVLTPINDPIELYCLSLVDSLRSMPRSERERVKYEFAKILKDAKYKDQS